MAEKGFAFLRSPPLLEPPVTEILTSKNECFNPEKASKKVPQVQTKRFFHLLFFSTSTKAPKVLHLFSGSRRWWGDDLVKMGFI